MDFVCRKSLDIFQCDEQLEKLVRLVPSCRRKEFESVMSLFLGMKQYLCTVVGQFDIVTSAGGFGASSSRRGCWQIETVVFQLETYFRFESATFQSEGVFDVLACGQFNQFLQFLNIGT